MNTPNFSDIYTLYFEDVYKYLLALCHDEELAEELAQDTFFKAMKSYENFRGDCKITTWLCQIAKHSFFLYEKHRKRKVMQRRYWNCLKIPKLPHCSSSWQKLYKVPPSEERLSLCERFSSFEPLCTVTKHFFC